MKTKILLAFFLFIGLKNVDAQISNSDFEFPNVPVVGYWDGADFSGGFQSGLAYFKNTYDTSFGFGFWAGGFGWSTLTDSVTSGFTNQMSAKAASGYNSPGYGIGQQHAVVVLNNGTAAQPLSVRFSNSTYAYNSMRDGDTFAKKFGGLTGNDPDFFKVVVFPYAGGNMLNDSAEFYLADFRFSDNTLDYLVSTWDSLDLSGLPLCDSLKFVLRSSDNGAFGMNTPAYFCLDDLRINSNLVGISEQTKLSAFRIFPNPCQASSLNLESKSNEWQNYSLYNTLGEIILSGSYIHQMQLNVEHLSRGVYYLHQNNSKDHNIKQWVKQ
jgi:hypothetical protein